MYKKQALICPPRTGSVYYCNKLSKKYNTKNLGELARPILLKAVCEKLEKQDNWLMKVVPGNLHPGIMHNSDAKNINKNLVDTIVSLIDISDKHYFLYRENFVEQVESYALGKMSNQWLDNRDATDMYIDEATVTNCKNDLLYQYDIIKQVYTARPGELVSLEQFGTKGERYPRKRITGDAMKSVQQIDILNTYFV